MACVERTVEEPGRPNRGAGRPPHLAGRHNCESDPGWGSERLIVAKKRGNARGVKEPYCKHASIEMEGEPLERKPLHYGRTGRNDLEAGSQQTGQDSGEIVFTEGEAGPKGQTRAEVSVLCAI